MITSNTTSTRSAIAVTVAAFCFAVAACGSEQGAVPDRQTKHATQHAAADDVAAQVEQRKGGLTQHMGRPQHAVADDVALWVEQRKSAHGTP